MKSSIWTTHENCEGSISLTRRIRKSSKPLRMLVRNWKHQLLLLCFVKFLKKNCGSGASNKNKTRLACNLEDSESTRQRLGESLPNHHEDHNAGKGDNSLHHYNWWGLHMKFLCSRVGRRFQQQRRGSVDKEWEKLEKISAWNLTKVRR